MLDQVSHGKEEGGKHVAWRVKKKKTLSPLTEISVFFPGCFYSHVHKFKTDQFVIDTSLKISPLETNLW